MDLKAFFPGNTLTRLVRECTGRQRTNPQWQAELLQETTKIWQQILAPGYPFNNVEFQAACLGFFDQDLPSPLLIPALTPLRARIACRSALGMTGEEIEADIGREAYRTLNDIRGAWQLPRHRLKFIAIRAAQGGYAPPPLLSVQLLRSTWHDLSDETQAVLVNKARGRHTANLDPDLLPSLGLRAWSGLPLVVSVVYLRFFEEIERFSQLAKLVISSEQEDHLAMIMQGWLPRQIGFFYGVDEQEVRRQEGILMRLFGVETRIELAYRALLRRTQQKGARYP